MNVNFDGRTYSFEVRRAGGGILCGVAPLLGPAYTLHLHPFPTLLVPLLCCLLQVKPGPDGYRQFTEAIRRAFTLPDDSELNITFTCDEPTTGGRAVCERVGGCGWADLVGCCSLHLQSSETVWGWRASCRPGWPAHLLIVWLSVQPRDMGRSPCPPHSQPATSAAVDNGSLLTLQGSGAYDAAVHCASVSAARRLTSPGVSRTVSAAEGGWGGHWWAGAGCGVGSFEEWPCNGSIAASCASCVAGRVACCAHPPAC